MPIYFPRSAHVAFQSAENLTRFFGGDAPYSVADMFGALAAVS